ncbi:MAG: B12-binding domain-containing radical SAM protein [Lachnospiraceae bacterium]|nr:B12-binding domain-containing radical SAM protein [Lachnospiraceae bacterium]
MKFLLVAVNSKYIHSNPAVYSLKSSLECLGSGSETVSIAEYTINQDPEEVRADIFQRKPDAIGFSCYIWNIRYVTDLAEDLAKLLPQTAIWVGGPEVSYRAEELMNRYAWLSGVMVGEGEAVFARLIGALAEGKRLPKEKSGLVYRDSDGTIQNGGVSAPVDFSAIPFVYGRDELPENRIVYYESSRGCPYRCSYCLSSIDKQLRFRNLDLVYQELQYFLDQKTAQVKFVDRTFNCQKERARQIWTFLRDHDNGITNFHFEISADLLEEADFQLLSTLREGLVQFEIGVQTTNPLTLRAIRRTAFRERIFSAVRRIAEGRNIHQHLDLIAGLPYEDYESFRRSFCQVYELHPDQLQLGFLKLLSGTEMEKEADGYGMVCSSRPPYEVLKTDWISFEELRRLKRVEEAVETFYNTCQFSMTVRYLEQKCADSFSVYELLGEFLGKLHEEGGKPGRRKLYERTAAFLMERWPQEGDQISQLLTFDYYSRENAKDRPLFCRASSEWKEEEKQFYIREAAKRQYLGGYAEADSRQLQRMTHLEVFDWDFVSETDGTPVKRKTTVVVFDYRIRDFKTFNAKPLVILDFFENDACKTAGFHIY